MPLKRLEPDEGKLSCPVLRGDWRSNAPPYPTIVKALFAMVIPPVFAPKVLFMMLQIRPLGVVHFHPESLVHFTPLRREVAYKNCSLNQLSRQLPPPTHAG